MPDKYGAKNSPWAISHFSPTLKVEILGLTKGAEERLRKVPLASYVNRIGAWVIDVQYIGNLVVL